jgi:PTH1 family peptidyl-tRNA hydrolase
MQEQDSVNEKAALEERLVVGLGNPEEDYADTRHPRFARAELARRGVKSDRKRCDGGRSGSASPVVITAAETGTSPGVRAKAVRDTHVPAQNVWVVYDELELPLCKMRIRRGGSGAGHNGVLSLISSLGTSDFVRFRVGIGKPPRKGSQPGRQHVLGRFTKTEAGRLPAVIDGVASALELALDAGIERAMDRYNRPGSLGCEELP